MVIHNFLSLVVLLKNKEKFLFLKNLHAWDGKLSCSGAKVLGTILKNVLYF